MRDSIAATTSALLSRCSNARSERLSIVARAVVCSCWSRSPYSDANEAVDVIGRGGGRRRRGHPKRDDRTRRRLLPGSTGCSAGTLHLSAPRCWAASNPAVERWGADALSVADSGRGATQGIGAMHTICTLSHHARVSVSPGGLLSLVCGLVVALGRRISPQLQFGAVGCRSACGNERRPTRTHSPRRRHTRTEREEASQVVIVYKSLLRVF